MSTLPSEFQFSENFEVTKEVEDAFKSNGYILVRGLMSPVEIQHLRKALEHPDGVRKYYYTRNDGEGREAKVTWWNQPGNDVTGVLARVDKFAGTISKLLGGEVYHYHSAVILKEARTGGAHVWHQDYGYWYENGCIFPDMGSAWLAVDKATKENGCLKVLLGSHKVGRIDHIIRGDQAGADLERVAQIHKFCELVHVEADPGDCLFIHANLLHRSDANSSDMRRWAFLVAYNRASNDPVYEHHHPKYTPMTILPNSAFLACNEMIDMSRKDFCAGPTNEMSLDKLKLKAHPGGGAAAAKGAGVSDADAQVIGED